ncbi:MAG: cytochrome P450 [Burkholderiaceae bacterium]
MSTAPVFEIDLQQFWLDPYPALRDMRAKAPIAFVPQLGATLLTRRDDVNACEKHVEVFSSHQPGGLMNRLMGHNLMRKDGAEHAAERQALFPSVNPVTVRDVWRARFQAHVDRILDDLTPRAGADLVRDYAMAVSAEALKEITGLTSARYEDMDAWSQGMIDGIANYAGDPGVEERCHRATAAIDDCISQMIPILDAAPNSSMLSVLRRSGMPDDSVRANIKLAISGGQNEPRDVIAGMVWALLEHPDQAEAVMSGEVSWQRAFEEYVRWMSPIGMSPRRIAKAHEYGGVRFEPDERIFLMFSSANRDEAHYDAPERFDVRRGPVRHVAFGAGPHFCAGAAASKVLIAEVAVPSLLQRLPGLRLAGEVPFGGWAFRGPLRMPVSWSPTRPAMPPVGGQAVPGRPGPAVNGEHVG